MTAPLSLDVGPFRSLAQTLVGVDLDVYAACGRDARDPVLGLGPREAKVAILGRDPGRNEIIHGQPFVGSGGRKVRDALHRRRYGTRCPDEAAALAVGDAVFWVNTVPYKPVGNKAWPARVRRAFWPLIAELLLTRWHGEHVLCLGNEAFHWFGLHDKALAATLRAHAARDDKYDVPLTVTLAAGGHQRALTLHLLPHPSPLNAVWASRVEDMIEARLALVGAP